MSHDIFYSYFIYVTKENKMKFLLGFITAIVLGVIVFLVVVYTGIISVKASDEESGFIRWTLETTMENSVKRDAGEIAIPAGLSNPERLKEGYKHYKQMCEFCHGAPGERPFEFTKGLNPKAPEMSHTAEEWNEPELFYIIKYGVKMTGMPSWGETLSEEEIWSIVALLARLARPHRRPGGRLRPVREI
jgi:mono/diheme cytochrome c family protein